MNALDNYLVIGLLNYIKRNNYNVKSDDFKLQLLSNPDFPSVKSITDTFDYFGIKNVVANVPKDALEQLPKFFLAIVKKNNMLSLAQVDRRQKDISLLHKDGSKQTISTDGFKNKWNGTIVVIEKKETKPNYQASTVFKNPFLSFILLPIIALLYAFYNLGSLPMFYTISTIVGLLVSYFIVHENMGFYNQFTSKICNSTIKNTSCSQVINSRASKLFNIVSLSDLSITYFAFMLIMLSVFGFNHSFFLVISLLSIPLVPYTLYNQAFVTKKWCPLCLMIAAILTLQMLPFLWYYQPIKLNLVYSISAIFSFGLIYVCWINLKQLILENLRLSGVETDFLKFKRDENIFKSALYEQQIEKGIELNPSTSIIFGNLNAKIVINAITNPMCGYCTSAFKAYDELLLKHPEKLKLNVIFNVPSDSFEHQSSQISQRIIELYQENKQEAYAALKDWFENRDASLWHTKYGMPSENANLMILKAHKAICTANKISYTPATILENHLFPKAYNITDIPFFMDNLNHEITLKKEPSLT